MKYVKCDPCYVAVNDLGQYQCRDCGMFFPNKKEILMAELRQVYGPDIVEDEYQKLKKLRWFALRNNNPLSDKISTTREVDKNGKIWEHKCYDG